MAELSVTEVIARIGRMPKAMAERTAVVMKEKIRQSTHGPGIGGHLADTVKVEQYADGTYYVGTNKFTSGPYGIREVGAIIRHGRPELWPRYVKALAFDPPPGWQGRVSKKGKAVIGHAGPADPNDFVEETVKEVESEAQSIWNKL